MNEQNLNESDLVESLKLIEDVFPRLTNPRNIKSLQILNVLLSSITGDPIRPSAIQKIIENASSAPTSKQSITNAAKRLDASKLIERNKDGYAVRYGFLIAVLLQTVISLYRRIEDLEDKIDELSNK